MPAGARSPRCRRSPSLTPPPRPTACAPLSAAAGRPGPTRNCGAATHSTQCAIVGQTPVVATGHGVPNWIGHAPGQAAGTPTRSPTRRRPRKRQPQQLRTSVARKKRESGVMVCGVLLRISLPRRMCWIHLSAEAWVAGMSAETSRQHNTLSQLSRGFVTDLSSTEDEVFSARSAAMRDLAQTEPRSAPPDHHADYLGCRRLLTREARRPSSRGGLVWKSTERQCGKQQKVKERQWKGSVDRQ